MFKVVIIVAGIFLIAPCATAGDATTTKQYDNAGRYKGYYQTSPDSHTTKFYDNSGKYKG